MFITEVAGYWSTMFFLASFLVTLAVANAQYFGNYQCEGNKDVFTHLFEWKWTDIARECETFLKDRYCAVQVGKTVVIPSQ